MADDVVAIQPKKETPLILEVSSPIVSGSAKPEDKSATETVKQTDIPGTQEATVQTKSTEPPKSDEKTMEKTVTSAAATKKNSAVILPIAAALIFVALLIAGVGLGVNYITRQNELLTSTPIPSPSVPTIGPQASVQLDTQYQSPFEEKTQYVNPFSEQKNPFDQLSTL